MAKATVPAAQGQALPSDRPACHCATLRRAARGMTRLYDEALAPAELRLTQYSLLATVDRSGPVALTPLAGALGMERTTLTRNLAPLLKRKLLQLEGAKGRTKVVRLTARGAAQLRTAYPFWLQAQREVTRRLGPANEAALTSLVASAAGS